MTEGLELSFQSRNHRRKIERSLVSVVPHTDAEKTSVSKAVTKRVGLLLMIRACSYADDGCADLEIVFSDAVSPRKIEHRSRVTRIDGCEHINAFRKLRDDTKEIVIGDYLRNSISCRVGNDDEAGASGSIVARSLDSFNNVASMTSQMKVDVALPFHVDRLHASVNEIEVVVLAPAHKSFEDNSLR